MFKNLWRRARAWWTGSFDQHIEHQLKIESEEMEKFSAIRLRIAQWVQAECDRSYREGFLAGRASMGGQR